MMISNYAFVFPGQGSQFVGMLSDLAAKYQIISDLFATVSDRIGYDVWQLITHGPAERLNQTMHTQVAMLTADVAIFKLLQNQGIPLARMMAGHSLGEYAALVCAGALDIADAATLVSMRGQLMQQVVPFGLGAMAAIVGLTDAQVQTICTEASYEQEQVTPANYNAIGQVVIAGHTPAVERAIELALQQEARLAKTIPVSVPCHCPLLMPAAELFADALAQTPFLVPEIPVISNVDLSIYTSVEQIRSLLQSQLYRPVRWVETIQLMRTSGVDWVIECGPGKVLSGLIKRIDKSIETASVHDTNSFDALLELFSN